MGVLATAITKLVLGSVMKKKARQLKIGDHVANIGKVKSVDPAPQNVHVVFDDGTVKDFKPMQPITMQSQGYWGT